MAFLVGGMGTNDFVWTRLQSHFREQGINICRPDNDMYALLYACSQISESADAFQKQGSRQRGGNISHRSCCQVASCSCHIRCQVSSMGRRKQLGASSQEEPMGNNSIRRVFNQGGLLPDSSQSCFFPRVSDGLLDTDIATFRRAIKLTRRRKFVTRSTSRTRIKQSLVASTWISCVITAIYWILNGLTKIHASSFPRLVFSS